MTPQEKAKELVARYMILFSNQEQYSDEAKQCALIAVDEIILSREDDGAFDDTKWGNSSEYYTPHPMYLNYWKLVKQEIIHRLDGIS